MGLWGNYRFPTTQQYNPNNANNATISQEEEAPIEINNIRSQNTEEDVEKKETLDNQLSKGTLHKGQPIASNQLPKVYHFQVFPQDSGMSHYIRLSNSLTSSLVA